MQLLSLAFVRYRLLITAIYISINRYRQALQSCLCSPLFMSKRF